MSDILPRHDRLQFVGAENLTRDEAQERARLLAVDSYDVSLDLTTAEKDSRTFTSSTLVRFTCTEPAATTHIDITADAITEATPIAQRVDAAGFTGKPLPLPPLAETNELSIVAESVFMRTGEGLPRFAQPVDHESNLYPQCEAFNAHRMYACLDQPDLKATFRF